jgi:hypothetical protein
MIARSAGMRGRDPVHRMRAQLKTREPELAVIEREVESAVTAAVEAAVGSLQEVPA